MNPGLENIRITIPVLVLIATGLLLCVYLFAMCKRQIQATSCAMRAIDETVAALSVRLMNEVGDLSGRLRTAEDRIDLALPPPLPPTGINQARRAQALRMLRHGAEPQTIAAALAVRVPEIELLASIEGLRSAAAAASAGGEAMR